MKKARNFLNCWACLSGINTVWWLQGESIGEDITQGKGKKETEVQRKGL
jgi:hypothetical protein